MTATLTRGQRVVAVASLAIAGSVFLPGRTGRVDAAPPTANIPPVVRSTMGHIAARIGTDVGPNAKDAVVFVAPLRSEEPAPRRADLTIRLGTLVAGNLGGGAIARPEQVSLAMAQTLAKGAKWLVFLQPEVARGQLQVHADVYRGTHNVWERARQPSPIPVAHSFASGRIDGEIRSYLGPVPLVANRLDKAAIDDRDIVAIACGDLGGGALEIVTLGRRRATVGRLQGDRFVARKSATLRELSSIAPTPLRDPIGGVAIVPGSGPSGYIDIGITDRTHGSRFDPDLRSVGSIAGIPFATPSGDACANFQGSTLSASVAKCSDTDAPIEVTDIEAEVDTIAVAPYVTSDGSVRTIVATRDPRTSELKVRVEGKTATLAHAGAQLALADLDQNGSPEVISSLDVMPKTPTSDADAVVISTWQPDGSLVEAARTAVPNGIRALAACPPEGAARAPVVVATQGELWVFH